MLRLKGKTRSRIRGQSAVEIGLVMPILILTLLGMAEVAWWLRTYIVVGTAAREGARYGSRGPHLGAVTQSDILNAASDTADTVQEAMTGLLDLDFSLNSSTATIMVTFVEIDSAGNWTVLDAGSGGPPTYKRGYLKNSQGQDVTTKICTTQPCDAETFDLVATAQENANFNLSSQFCPETNCPGDLAVVEVYYKHTPLIFRVNFLPDEIITNSWSVMRIVVKQS